MIRVGRAASGTFKPGKFSKGNRSSRRSRAERGVFTPYASPLGCTRLRIQPFLPCPLRPHSAGALALAGSPQSRKPPKSAGFAWGGEHWLGAGATSVFARNPENGSNQKGASQ
jgi:hypothetical protein